MIHTEHFGNFADPAILLIAGAMAPGRFWSERFCQGLAGGNFFVIRYDHRDTGKSFSVDWENAPYTLSDLAQDAIKVLDRYKIKQAHFVGHSMGGFICQQIAMDYPERVLSIIPISAGPLEPLKIPLSSEEKAILEKTWQVFLTRKDDSFQAFLPVWKYLNGTIPLDEEMAFTYTQGLSLKPCNNHERVMADIGKSKILKKINAPTLVIHGDQDPLILPRDGIALAKAIPGSELVMIPGMGHMLFNRELESKIVKILSNFLICQK